MKSDYINFYNNLIKLTTNKSLYKGISSNQDNFSDRLTLFLFHFAFILKQFKSKNDKILQELYDFNFRQLELSIREIAMEISLLIKNERLYKFSIALYLKFIFGISRIY